MPLLIWTSSSPSHHHHIYSVKNSWFNYLPLLPRSRNLLVITQFWIVCSTQQRENLMRLPIIQFFFALWCVYARDYVIELPTSSSHHLREWIWMERLMNSLVISVNCKLLYFITTTNSAGMWSNGTNGKNRTIRIIYRGVL